MPDGQPNLASVLIDCGAVRFGDFVLKSGLRTDYYVDIKRASTSPKALRMIGKAMAHHALGVDSIAGMELGAVPLAVAVSLETDLPFLMVRKASKGHGTKDRIEGLFEKGQRVLVVEDVTTTGGSSIEASQVLTEAGLHVARVVSVVDRGEHTASAFQAAGLPFTALVTARDLLVLKGESQI